MESIFVTFGLSYVCCEGPGTPLFCAAKPNHVVRDATNCRRVTSHQSRSQEMRGGGDWGYIINGR